MPHVKMKFEINCLCSYATVLNPSFLKILAIKSHEEVLSLHKKNWRPATFSRNADLIECKERGDNPTNKFTT